MQCHEVDDEVFASELPIVEIGGGRSRQHESTEKTERSLYFSQYINGG